MIAMNDSATPRINRNCGRACGQLKTSEKYLPIRAQQDRKRKSVKDGHIARWPPAVGTSCF